jgi:CopG family transcriptional regulator, nickel-responsive regulator
MRRLTISIDDDVADRFDQLMKEKGYANRSEAFRDLLRGELGRDQLEAGSAKYCVGALSYVYNHHERQLATRLMQIQHDHHDLTVSSMHAHLDHENCLETVMLRGPTQQVIEFAKAVIAEKGIRHGRFHPIPVEPEKAKFRRAGHMHLHPTT